MKKEKQIITIIRRLKKTGSVNRNWALNQGITRLASIICTLKKHKYKFSVGFDEGNYIYVLRNSNKVFNRISDADEAIITWDKQANKFKKGKLIENQKASSEKPYKI